MLVKLRLRKRGLRSLLNILKDCQTIENITLLLMELCSTDTKQQNCKWFQGQIVRRQIFLHSMPKWATICVKIGVGMKIRHYCGYMHAGYFLPTYMQNCFVKLIYSWNYFSGLPCLCLCLHPMLKSPHGSSYSLKFLPSYTVCLVVDCL